MTYKQLAERIQRLPLEQQEMDVTVSCDVSKEAFKANYFHVIGPDDFMGHLLDKDHPIISISF
jgi:hypothetical protein